MCVCWRDADYVSFRELFQPARGCMGRWSGHQYAGAPPPVSRPGGVGGLLCAHNCQGADKL
eukprot:scaffold92693_cov61-Phaeocystis_antarctica.AAC.1